MATVVHRLTLEIRLSVNPVEPEYQTGDWLIDPVTPDAPKRHWEVIGDDIQLKSAAERDIADAEYLEEYKDTKNLILEEEFTSALEDRYSSDRKMMLITMRADAKIDGLANRAAYIQPLLDWVNHGTAQLYAAQDAVSGATHTGFVDGVSQNISGWLASDPEVSIRTASGITD